MIRETTQFNWSELTEKFKDRLREQWNELIDDDLDLAKLRAWGGDGRPELADRTGILHS